MERGRTEVIWQIYPWVASHTWAGIDDEKFAQFPNVKAWLDRIAERPAVKLGTGDKYACVLRVSSRSVVGSADRRYRQSAKVRSAVLQKEYAHAKNGR